MDHLGIPLSLSHKFRIGPALDDSSATENEDRIRVLDGTQAVRDGDGGAAVASSFQRGLNDSFGFRVQSGGRFVKDTDTRSIRPRR